MSLLIELFIFKFPFWYILLYITCCKWCDKIKKCPFCICFFTSLSAKLLFLKVVMPYIWAVVHVVHHITIKYCFRIWNYLDTDRYHKSLYNLLQIQKDRHCHQHGNKKLQQREFFDWVWPCFDWQYVKQLWSNCIVHLLLYSPIPKPNFFLWKSNSELSYTKRFTFKSGMVGSCLK